MKLKLDFISNSSSTSFVYISRGELSKEAFFEAAGVDLDSPVADIFAQMHAELESALADGDNLLTKQDIDEYAADVTLMPDVIEKMHAALAEGKNVVKASLDSDGELAESLLCVEIFEIESDEFFINAHNNYW